MKNSTIAVSENIRAYSAAVIADAAAAVMRARRVVQESGDMLTHLKKRRESVARAKPR